MKFDKILCVCVGNICRSPAAEKLLARELGSKARVSSAGISAVVGAPIHEISSELLCEKGINDCTHVAKQLTDSDVRNNDLILVMEKQHIKDVCDRYPNARGKIFLLTQWEDKRDIPDPYKKSHDMFVLCLDMIDQSVKQWAAKI